MATNPEILERNRVYYKEKLKGSERYRNYKRQYAKEWRKKYPDKVKLARKKAGLKAMYGLAYEDFLQMQQEQEGRCLLCQEISMLVVDHNHKTGEVRGLLCNNCNMAIGLMKENKETFARAMEYL